MRTGSALHSFQESIQRFFFHLTFLSECVKIWLLELAKCISIAQNQAVKREQHQYDAVIYLPVTKGCNRELKPINWISRLVATAAGVQFESQTGSYSMAARAANDQRVSKIYFKYI